MSCIYDLPSPVFEIIRDYLVYYPSPSSGQSKSWKNFLNSSKNQHLLDVKREFNFFSFSSSISSHLLDYFQDCLPFSHPRYERISCFLSKSISQPSLQIAISSKSDLTHSRPMLIHSFQSSCSNIMDISFLQNVKYVNLRGCSSISDISFLSACHSVNLSWTEHVVNNDNIAFLRKVKILKLEGCHAITDVSSLKDVFDLSLAYSLGVSDVSMLGRVHRLNLHGCIRVEDLSELHFVHSLNISGLAHIKKGLPADNMIRDASFSKPSLHQLEKVSSGKRGSLRLSGGCPSLSSVVAISAFSSFCSLSFDYISTLPDLSSLFSCCLISLKRLSFNHCSFTSTQLPSFPCLRHLKMSHCKIVLNPTVAAETESWQEIRSLRGGMNIRLSSMSQLEELYCETVPLGHFIISGSQLKKAAIKKCGIEKNILYITKECVLKRFDIILEKRQLLQIQLETPTVISLEEVERSPFLYCNFPVNLDIIHCSSFSFPDTPPSSLVSPWWKGIVLLILFLVRYLVV
jgi:hypothetical protein